MDDELEVEELPPCDICAGHGGTGTAVYRARTRIGSWANVCEDDFATFGTGFGPDRGQRLVLRGRGS